MNRPLEGIAMARLCSEGVYSPIEIAMTCLARMKAAEPETCAFLSLDEDRIMARAELLASEGPPPEGAGRLFGVPVAVKDNICVEGQPCTCGSKSLERFKPIFSACVIRRIEAEGGIVFGKTNMDEFGMGSTTEFSAFKTTRNPWDASRIPGGSSGGSAAAVASGVVPLALGTDTGGSIRQPAALCGTVGFKPTYGTVSRFGLVAFASSLDQIGPFGKTVRDVARLFEVIAGHDADDSTSVPDYAPDVMSRLDEGATGLCAGVPEEYLDLDIDPQIRSAVERALDSLEKASARIEKISLPHTKFAIPAYFLVADSEASSNLSRFDGVRYGARNESGDLMEMYESTRAKGFGLEVKRRIMLGTFSLSSGYYDAYYLKAMKVRQRIKNDFADAFRKVDLIVGPTSPVPAFPLGERVDDPLAMYACDSLTVPASLAGLPGLSLPCGLTADGLPIGLQIVGPELSDACVLRTGKALETALGAPMHSKLSQRMLKIVEPGLK